VKNYHAHLNDNPRSLLAKIYGCFSIKVNNKNKVYHILMENLDPLDDEFILFKYDMKFSTVNRKEINSNSTIRAIKNTFLKQMPWAKELFDNEEAIEEGKSKNRSSGGYRVSVKKNILNKIDERSFESSEEDDNGLPLEETKDVSRLAEDRPEFQSDQRVIDEEEEDESISDNQRASKHKPHSEGEEKMTFRLSNNSKVSSPQKRGTKLIKAGNYRGSMNSSSNFEDEAEFVDQSTLKKLGLLKDEDFLRMHKCLLVNVDCKMEVEMLNASLEKDAKFLTALNIMDYSLFVVIIQAPNDDPYMRDSNTDPQETESEEEVDHDHDPETNSSNFTEKQMNLAKAVSSLIAGNKYVLYSRKRNFIYLVGLIDYLQKYIRKKKLERLGKQLVAFNNLNEDDTDFSCQPPEQYFQRFMDKVTEVFKFVEGDDERADFDHENEGY